MNQDAPLSPPDGQPIASSSRLLSPPPPPTISSSSSSSTSTPQINDPLSRDFPQTSHLSREDLEMLLEDPAYFDAWFNTTIPQALQLQRAVEQQIQANLELAQKSQQLKPELDRLRQETGDLFHEAQELKMRAGLLEEAQREGYKRFSHDSQLSRYRASFTLQEHLCEQIVTSFIEGRDEEFQDEESFVRQYREVRKVYHKRKTGLEKWEEGKVVWET